MASPDNTVVVRVLRGRSRGIYGKERGNGVAEIMAFVFMGCRSRRTRESLTAKCVLQKVTARSWYFCWYCLREDIPEVQMF